MSVPVTRASALGGLLVTHMQTRRQGIVCFLVNASLLGTGEDYRQSCPDEATAEEVFQSIQSILSDHPLEAERVFNGQVRSHGHTKPNDFSVVSFIFQASGLSTSQSTFLKQELLLKHTGRLPVTIPNRGEMPFTLFNEKPSDAAVLFTISTRLATEAVSSVLSEILGMKPFFVTAIDHATAGKMGETVGDHKPSSLGLAAKRLGPNVTHMALVSALDATAYRLLRERRDGFKLELEGEDPASAPVVHVNRVYPVIPRSKTGPNQGAAKRSRADSFATDAWGKKPAPPPSAPIPSPSSAPNPASSPTLSAGRVTDREVNVTVAPAPNVANPSSPTAEPQVLVTQQGTGPEDPSLVEGDLTVVGARKATGGPEGDVSKNDQKCAKTRSPEEETHSGQKRDREGKPQPSQDPVIEATADCSSLKVLLKALIAASPRDEDEIGRTARQLCLSYELLQAALDTQIQSLKDERKTILGKKKMIGESKAQKEIRQAQDQQLLERKGTHEVLRAKVVAELAALLEKVEAETEAKADETRPMDDDEDDYGAERHLDEVGSDDVLEMVGVISSEGIDETMSDEAMAASQFSKVGRASNLDGTTMSMRVAGQKAKAATEAAKDQSKDGVEKPKPKDRSKGKDSKTSLTLQRVQKEQEEAAMDVGAATAVNDE